MLSTDRFRDLGRLDRGESETVSFVIVAQKEGIFYPFLNIYWKGSGSKIETLSYPLIIKVEDTPLEMTLLDAPTSLEVGEEGTFRIGLSNSRQNSLSSVFVSTKTSGISIYPERNFVGIVEPNSISVVEFSIIPNEEEDVKINVTATYMNGDNLHHAGEVSLEVPIESKTPQIETELRLGGTNSMLNRGDVRELIFTVKNNGPAVDDLDLGWVGEQGFIIPIESRNERHIERLEEGESLEIPFTVAVQPNIDFGLYYISYNLKYLNVNNILKELSGDVGFIVGGETDFSLSLEETSEAATVITIFNVGLNPASSIDVEIPEQGQFRTVGSQVAVLGDLNPGEKTSITFNILSESDEELTIFEKPTKMLEVLVRYTDTLGKRHEILKEIDVSDINLLRTEELSLTLPFERVQAKVEVEVSFEGGRKNINSGETSTLHFLVKNLGPAVHNLEFSWKGEQDFIIPVGSNNRRSVPEIGEGETVDLTFEVAAQPGLDYRLYTVTYDANYLDPDNVLRNLSDMTGIIVGGTTELEVNFQGVGGTETSFSVANVGVNPAQALTVEVPAQDGISVTGGSSSTVGNLNPGDFTLVSFSLRTQGRQGSQDVIILLKYTDTLGSRQIVEKVVKVPSDSTGFAKGEDGFNSAQRGGMGVPMGMFTGTYLYVIIVVVVGAIMGAIFYKRRKRGRRQ